MHLGDSEEQDGDLVRVTNTKGLCLLLSRRPVLAARRSGRTSFIRVLPSGSCLLTDARDLPSGGYWAVDRSLIHKSASIHALSGITALRRQHRSPLPLARDP